MITTSKVSLESLYIDTTGMAMMPVTILGDYRENDASGVIDAGTLSQETTQAITKMVYPILNAKVDSWHNSNAQEDTPISSPACSCLMKKLPDGTVIMGRNMDLPISFSPVIIFRIKGDNKTTYDTVNLSYSAPGSMLFDQIVELKAIPEPIFLTYAVTCCDALNSEGLYLQYNMRECLDCVNTSTNPTRSQRVVTCALIRLLADHCATIDEALAYLNNLDIYDPKTPNFDWSMAIGMMDKTGKYGVVEFVNNKVVWNEGRDGVACGQANFYWSKEARSSRFGAGLGRWRKMMEYYNDIHTEHDMEQVMNTIHYSNFITNNIIAKDWTIDWFTEMNDKIPYFINNRLAMIYSWRDDYGIQLNEVHLAQVLKIAEREKAQGGPIWTFDYLRNPENYYDIITFMDFFIECFAKLPIEAQKMSGYMECTTIGYTANNKSLGYTNHFFEMNDIYHIGLYETKIERIPTTKKLGHIK